MERGFFERLNMIAHSCKAIERSDQEKMKQKLPLEPADVIRFSLHFLAKNYITRFHLEVFPFKDMLPTTIG